MKDKLLKDFEEGYYTFQFSYLDSDGNENFEVRSITDPCDSGLAVKIASQFASEHGANKLQWVVKNTFARKLIEDVWKYGVEAEEGKFGRPSPNGDMDTHRGRFPANLLVENSILDTVICTCSTAEENTPIAESDWNSEEGGTEATTQDESPTAKNGARKSRRLSKENGSPKNTDAHSPKPVSLFSINGDGSQSEAPIETELTEDGCKPSKRGTDLSARSVGQQKTSTTTISNHGRNTQNSDSTPRTAGYCALHATGKPRPTESNQQYSRFFSLDAWAKTLPFLIVPKASKREKNEGLGHLPTRRAGTTDGNSGTSGRRTAGNGITPIEDVYAKNHHPTVKPLTLMSYLITLGSRPNDVVLDPFLGSGTTALAAKQLGRKFIGIEREAEYVEIAKARLKEIQPPLL